MEENNQELNQEPMQEENQESVQNEQPQVAETVKPNQEESVETKFTPMGQVNEPKPKKKKGKVGIILFVLLLLIAAIGGLAYYYFNVYTNTKVVYQQILKTGINSFAETSEEITTLKAKTKLDVEIEVDENYLEEGVDEILDIINNINATVEMQMDTTEKKAIFKLDSNYENEELLNVDMLFDAKNKGTYVKLDQFFEDILEVEMEDEYYEELESAFELTKESEEDQKARAKAVEILNKEFANIIKDEYCSKEKEKITIADKEVNADKYILKMTYPQLIEELTAVFTNLKNNEEFLSCFDDEEEVKDMLEETLEEFEFASEEFEDATLTINLYRTGLKQDFVKVTAEVEVDGEDIAVKVTKINNSYDFVLTELDEELFWASIGYEKLENNMVKLNVRFDAGDIVEAEINIEYGYTINEPIDAIETKDAKTLDEFTTTEQQEVLEKLEDSKLYELIEDFSELSTGADYGDVNIQVPDYGNTEEIPDEDGEVSQLPNDDTTMSNLQKNIVSNAVYTEGGAFIVFATNNNTIPVDMEIEVEYYDAQGTILGSSSDDLMAVGAGREIAIEMWGAPSNFATYKIYVDVEETIETEYFDKIETTHNNNGENIVVQVKNNSADTIDYITVSVVYYNQGNIVGIADGITSDVKTGRSGNFNVYFPFDAEYEDIEFDDYEVYVTEAYSYNW